LVPLDRRMSRRPLTVRYAGRLCKIDLPHIDRVIQEENSLAFGAVRELFIRNCYFRFHRPDYPSIRNVVDLGGNRGLFSVLCANFCSKIILVEPQAHYNDIIRYNLHLANPDVEFVIVNKFIGGAGKLPAAPAQVIGFNTLMRQFDMETIDFLKIDIEGAEFALFEEEIPFDKIRRLSMEVHRDFGKASTLTKILRQHHFQYITASSEFRQTKQDDEIDYIYAWKLT
jgi:hypothetical protein